MEEYVKVDINNYVNEILKNSTVIEAEKFARIIAKQGIEGEEVISWSIDQNNTAIIEKKDTNPIQSIIREILSNAIDANIAAGVQKPVQVHFANPVEPVFYIKDFGIGMTEEEIIKVFGTYGASNKRNDNSPEPNPLYNQLLLGLIQTSAQNSLHKDFCNV